MIPDSTAIICVLSYVSLLEVWLILPQAAAVTWAYHAGEGCKNQNKYYTAMTYVVTSPPPVQYGNSLFPLYQIWGHSSHFKQPNGWEIGSKKAQASCSGP